MPRSDSKYAAARGTRGAIRKRTSANAPPLAAHCPSFCAATLGRFLALSACLRTCACWRAERVSVSSAKTRHLSMTSTRTTVKQPFLGKTRSKNDSVFQSLFYSKGVSLYSERRARQQPLDAPTCLI